MQELSKSKSTNMEKVDFVGLEQATKAIDASLNADEKYPELYEQLMDQSEPHNYFFEPYLTQWKPQIVRKGGLIAMPSGITSYYDKMKCLCLSGIFPSIHHGWISIDNILFLWDYTKKEKFVCFDGLDQVIVSVGIATPLPGVFKPFVRHILVIATAVEVTLVALMFEDDDVLNGDVKLQATKLSISTDDIVLRRIISTESTGRIFMGGSDGTLHEFIYDAEETVLYQLGLSSKCHKISHPGGANASALMNYVPGFLRSLGGSMDSQYPDKIIEMAFDSERSILYSLHQNSFISVYDLGTSCKETIYLTSKAMQQEAINFCRQRRRGSGVLGGRGADVNVPDERIFRNQPPKVVSICVVPRSESEIVHLIGVTTDGIRFYLSTFKLNGGISNNSSSGYRSRPNSRRPTGLTMLHIRLPPPTLCPQTYNLPEYHITEGLQPGFLQGKPASCSVHGAYYKHGVLLLANGGQDQHDEIVSITQDLVNRNLTTAGNNASNSNNLASGKPILRESVSTDSCHGKIWQIEEYYESHAARTTTNGTNNDAITSSSKRSYNEISTTGNRINNNINDSKTPLIVGEMVDQYLLSLDNANLSTKNATNMVQTWGQRHFLCMTNAGLHVYKKLRPLDQLHRVLVSRPLSSFSGSSSGTRHLSSQVNTSLEYFFRAYGQVQVCCMLFALACGVPTDADAVDASTSSNSMSVTPQKQMSQKLLSSSLSTKNANNGNMLYSSAVQAIFEFGGYPGVASPQSVGGGPGGRLVMTDDVYMSGHHDGLVMFLSRMLRPIWQESIFIMSGKPAKKVKKTATNGSAKTINGTIEYHWRFPSQILQRIREILFALKELMQEATPYAMAIQKKINHVESTSTQNGPTYPAKRNVLFRNSKVNSNATAVDEMKTFRKENALEMEQYSIRMLYQLLCRCIESLSFLLTLQESGSVLKSLKKSQSNNKQEINEWSRLTFEQFVKDPVGVTLSRSLVNMFMEEMMQRMHSNNPSSQSSHSIDVLINRLRQQCPTVFSMGDVWQYQGYQALTKAKEGLLSPIQQQKYLQDSLAFFLRSCELSQHQHQHSSFNQNDSSAELNIPWNVETVTLVEKITADYLTLHFFQGIVELSLSCANSFPIAEQDEQPQDRSSQPNGMLLEVENGNILQQKKAMRIRCYQCILKCLQYLLIPSKLKEGRPGSVVGSNINEGGLDEWVSTPENVRETFAQEILQRSLLSQDRFFHNVLYEWLYRHEQHRVLVEIRSPFIESFLLGKENHLNPTDTKVVPEGSQEEELIAKFYVKQARFMDAAHLMWQKAHAMKEEAAAANDWLVDSNSNNSSTDIVANGRPHVTVSGGLCLSKRLEYLTRALGYAKSCSRFNNDQSSNNLSSYSRTKSNSLSNSTSVNGSLMISSNIKNEISEKLDVVQLQASVLAQLEAETANIIDRTQSSYSQQEINTRRQDIETLNYCLVDVSSLYNKYAAKYEMWEQCLFIMHSCNAEDLEVICSHWLKLIYVDVPVKTRNDKEDLRLWLESKHDEAELNVLSSSLVDENGKLFEDPSWIGNLRHKLRKLGRKLYGTGADFTFPVQFLAKELETLWFQYSACNPSNGASVDLKINGEWWVMKLFQDIGVSFSVLFRVYKQLYMEQSYHSGGDNIGMSSYSSFWQMHILECVVGIVSLWMKHIRSTPLHRSTTIQQDRLEFADSCGSIVQTLEGFTTDLQSTPHFGTESSSSKTKLDYLEEIRLLKRHMLDYRQDYN